MSRRSYHRYGNSYHSKVNNKAYTKGYQDGFADAEKGIDNYDSYSKESTLLANLQQLQKKQNTYAVIKMVMMMESKPNG